MKITAYPQHLSNNNPLYSKTSWNIYEFQAKFSETF